MDARLSYARTTLAVWEITLRCNLSCSHCGSRAGAPREHELSIREALDLVDQLAECGFREVALIGGEAFLRADWLDIAAAITRAGLVCSMTTGGYGLNARTAERMKRAGMRHVSVSVDGLESTHDHLRGRRGSYHAAMSAIQHLRAVDLLVGANTQINRLTAPDLPALYETLRDAGLGAWQVQLTVPSGHAADHPDILLQPFDLIDVHATLARIAARAIADRITFAPGNNIGYHGPYDSLFVAAGASPGIGRGCQAGAATLGIEADGTIKGCPSLAADHYGGGNIRDRRLRDILESAGAAGEGSSRRMTAHEDVWGFCATCAYKDPCRAGCTWTAHAFFNRAGNNPYCHHRALTMAAAGLRERLVPVARAPGNPFDNGTFEIVVEPSSAMVNG